MDLSSVSLEFLSFNSSTIVLERSQKSWQQKIAAWNERGLSSLSCIWSILSHSSCFFHFRRFSYLNFITVPMTQLVTGVSFWTLRTSTVCKFRYYWWIRQFWRKCNIMMKEIIWFDRARNDIIISSIYKSSDLKRFLNQSRSLWMTYKSFYY